MAVAVCDDVVVAVGAVRARQADDPRRVLARPANVKEALHQSRRSMRGDPSSANAPRWHMSSNPLPGESI